MSFGFSDRTDVPSPRGEDRTRQVVVLCTLMKMEDAAVLVSTGVGSVWLPRSQVAIERGMFGALRVTLPAWLARDKGLVGEPADGQGSLF